MFSVFGSPLQEDFTDSRRTTLKGCSSLKNGSVSCPNSVLKLACENLPSESDTSDSEMEEARNEEDRSNRNNRPINSGSGISKTVNGSDSSSGSDSDSDGEEETSSTTAAADPDSEEDVVDEQDEVESFVDYREEISEPTPGRETFVGSNTIEHFTNNSLETTKEKIFSPNNLLKAIMVTCLFYVLAHKDTQDYVLKNILPSVKPSMYLYLAMALFFVLFYLISVFL